MAWWQQWKVQCFDSLIPTKAWTEVQIGVKKGDVVLISYTDKSKTGTFRLGIVKEVEIDQDDLVRTCLVGYRLVRSDMPAEELKFYYKGMKWKEIGVPIQRLCIILPVEEHGVPEFLKKGNDETEEVGGNKSGNEESRQKEELSHKKENGQNQEFGHIEDLDDIALNDKEQKSARLRLVESFRISKVKKKGRKETSRSVKTLHRNMSLWDINYYEVMWRKELKVKERM